MAERHLAPVNSAAESIMETVIVKGDLSKLTSDERAVYYAQVCRSMGLNPLTKPFDYLTLSGKTVLYASRTATDQLRKINGVSIEIIGRETVNGVYVVTARATDATGRTDTEIGAVTLDGLKGDAYANALMKATTKAKRRATLSICGLGWLDETEVETIPNARIGEPASEPIKTTAQLSQPSEPTPIKTTVAPTPQGDKKVDTLAEAKATLWREAQAKGLTLELLEDYAQSEAGAGLGELTTAAVVKLTQQLKRADRDALLDRLTNQPGDGEYVDVELMDLASPDRFTR